ncbi:MAG: patatin-like phospholipase family protein [Planctomycetes bacterium]|nr:patatin-like phospholipase family protein [Planctomycetota bacterium]
MNNEIPALLKVHEYFRGASEEALRDVLDVGRIRHFEAGEIVHQPEESVVMVEFILRGRLKSVKVDTRGRETLFRFLERGEQFGMMAGALHEPIPLRVFSLEPSTVLQVDYETAMELTLKHPDLRQIWLRTYASSLKKHFFGSTSSRAPMILVLIHESPASRSTAELLLSRLREVGEEIAVFSDSDDWHKQPGMRFRSLTVAGRPLEPEQIRQQVAEWKDTHRIVFDIHAQMTLDGAERVMKLADRAVYFVPAKEGEAAVARLRGMDVAARGWRDKLSIAWLLEEGRTVAPAIPGLHDFICRDFKLAAPAPLPWSRSLSSGLERLVHDLRGVRIGVALGGGAARGMSHLGVLKALEQNGIVVDMVAGTSAGAMTGIMYATGLDADYSANQFATDLRPSWIFRRLPSGKQLYLLYKYRRGHFDPMLRKYLQNWRLEQLSLPCLSVTVDLVSGSSVVRERGDATHAVLESINLPVLSTPIVRDGQALIDGGLVNNIPADVLVAMGCNFVIAVSVTAKMEKRFCEITSEKPVRSGKKPSTIQTILRSLLVQNHSLNAIGVQPADVVIEPDVTEFDLTEFMRAKELAAIGEAAALEQIPKIQQLLTRLDPQLFPWSAEARR